MFESYCGVICKAFILSIKVCVINTFLWLIRWENTKSEGKVKDQLRCYCWCGRGSWISLSWICYIFYYWSCIGANIEEWSVDFWEVSSYSNNENASRVIFPLGSIKSKSDSVIVPGLISISNIKGKCRIRSHRINGWLEL